MTAPDVGDGDIHFALGVAAQRTADLALAGGEPGVRALAEGFVACAASQAAHDCVDDRRRQAAWDLIDDHPGLFA